MSLLGGRFGTVDKAAFMVGKKQKDDGSWDFDGPYEVLINPSSLKVSATTQVKKDEGVANEATPETASNDGKITPKGVAEQQIDWESLTRKALEYAQAVGGRIVTSGGGFIGGVVSGVSTFVIGLIFSFYILLQKEKLSRHGRQVIYGLLPMEKADRTLEILRLANRTFSHFLSGQCLEACILGTLFAAAMTIFRMPYALLVGVLIALTALIPIVGAFIGCGVGALLIAIDDPWKALWFVVMFLVLQQIEGNLIYPHVVGSSVGLPSIWVLAAVTLGGSLMGVLGMLLFIPLCSVVYSLFRAYVKDRLTARNVPAEKWRDPPPPVAPPRKKTRAPARKGTKK